MPTSIEKVYEDLDFASNRISEQTRTISIGIIALVWLFLAGGDDAPVLPSKPSTYLLLATAGLALLALVLDYLQYLIGYLGSDRLRARAEKEGLTEVEYDYNSPLYVARKLAYWFKQAFVMASVILLFASVIRSIVCA